MKQPFKKRKPMVADVYRLLRSHVQSKMDLDAVYAKDCHKLSEQIFKVTNRQVSSSTLKRFFGLVRSRFKPSKYTLDTLAEFVGFKDWHDFLNSYDDGRYSTSKYDTWVLLNMRVMQITDHCMVSLRQKTRYKAEKVIPRSCINDRFNDFRNSDARGTMFVAPDGYGKSTAMIYLAEKILNDTTGEFKDDIVCLIDGGIFFNLYSQNHNIELLNQLVDFKIQSSISVYFQQNPEKRKGRFWLMIDSVDEIFFDAERYQHTVENLMRILMANNNSWFKVILSCRPENLDAFSLALNKNPVLKSYWHDVNFSEEQSFNAINIPLYSHDEIKTVLEFSHSVAKYEKIFSQYNDVLEIIAHPFSLSLFIGAFEQNDNITEIILLNRYINTKVLSPPFLEEKLELISRYIKLCNFGKSKTSVRKDELLVNKNSIPAYRELISNGIIFEYIIPEDCIIQRKYVGFSQEIVFSYLVLNAWSTNRPYSTELFTEILNFYNCTKSTQCRVLKLFIKKLLHHNNLEVIKGIYQKYGQRMVCRRYREDNTNCACFIKLALDEIMENNNEIAKVLMA